MRHSAWLVQDHESGRFLAPDCGTVVFVPLVRDAGHFDDHEAAVLTALDWCDMGFSVVEVVLSS